MFGCEQSHELDVAALVQPVDRAAARGVYTGLIGDQADLPSADQVAGIRQQHIDAGTRRAFGLRDPRPSLAAGRKQRCTGDERKRQPPRRQLADLHRGARSL